LYTACLLSACATQTYDAKPIESASLESSFAARNLEDAGLRNYMLAQGYPQNALPIKQWGLRELTLAAYYFHPDLNVARAQWQAAQAAEITAGQRPNPGVSGALEHHSKTDGGISPWTYGISLAVPVETAGKRQERMDQVTSLSEAARIEIGQSAWQVRSHLRDSLLEYQAALRRISLLQQEVILHAEILQMLENRLQAGLASSMEVSNTRLQLQKAQHGVEAEKGRAAGLRSSVAAAAGLPSSALDGVQFDNVLPDRGTVGDNLSAQNIQRTGLLNRLDMRSALARYEATEANLRLEIARQYPDITLSPGYLWDQGDVQWSLGLSTILALMNKNEGPIAEARAARELQASQFNALQTRIIGELEQSLINYQAGTERVIKAEHLLAAQQLRTAQTEHQFGAGYADRLELAQARLQALAVEQGVLDAKINAQQALNALEDAVQRPLDGSAPLPEIPQEVIPNE
jgi:cobalt-zinc-cadmium efflux system outer membrane protein